MAAVDAGKEIRRAVDSGEVFFGRRESEKSILKGDGQLLIISGNIPKLVKEKLQAQASVAGVPVYEFMGTGLELGSVCGKPFSILSMVVVKPGKSNVLSLGGEAKA
ncbi:MAG TPA: 50S ribosomal protein L30e [Candidatus Diapherotrites archaeon]|uniref:Large ribosomal subunit protein eL30 n=1 Tax=Candidatus Iainarchaeum sp. TaxID=3101447 RepID=A0A7J4JE21_9ARCH|nr:50S ribosomal protein L30e [Candidatus Diapherotrites archaeon]HIH16012.1 50S ribosomal protein L30e [Candidatus Diapherotrites archaeon]